MSKFVQGAIVTLVLVAALAASSAQAAVTIFLSDKGFGSGATLDNPTFTGAVGSTIPVYVWIRDNDSSQPLGAVSLNLATDKPGTLQGVDATVFNPEVSIPGVFVVGNRWNGVGPGTPNPAATPSLLDENFNGVAGFQGATGIQSQYQVVPKDQLYDAAANAFLFAQVNIRITDAGANGAHLFLQNSSNLTGKLGGSSQDIDIFFGAGEQTTMKGAVANTNSALPDGTVLVPEPASLALLALGGLALARRRGRKA